MIPHDRNNFQRGSQASGGESHIPSLDGLRAISIVLVLLGHAMPFGTYPFLIRVFFRHSDLGVRVFFVISGYLITGLLLRERAQFGSVSLSLFYIRRALRILPAFVAFVGCVALLSLFGVIHIPSRLWVFVLTYTVNFTSFDSYWALAHLWSLSVEEQFYLLWPLLMKVASPAVCIWVAVLSIFASPIFHTAHQLIGLNLWVHAFPYACGPIAMGCLLALKADAIRSRMVSSRFLSSGWTLLAAVFSVALLDLVPNHYGAPTIFLGILTNTLMTLCVARLIFIPTGFAGRVLNSPPAVILGKLSYSLYLWQELFLRPADPPVPTRFPVNILLALACASACYWGLEARFLGLRRKYRRRPAENAPIVELVGNAAPTAVGS